MNRLKWQSLVLTIIVSISSCSKTHEVVSLGPRRKPYVDGMQSQFAKLTAHCTPEELEFYRLFIYTDEDLDRLLRSISDTFYIDRPQVIK